jgi:hypothetical protein
VLVPWKPYPIGNYLCLVDVPVSVGKKEEGKKGGGGKENQRNRNLRVCGVPVQESGVVRGGKGRGRAGKEKGGPLVDVVTAIVIFASLTVSFFFLLSSPSGPACSNAQPFDVRTR